MVSGGMDAPAYKQSRFSLTDFNRKREGQREHRRISPLEHLVIIIIIIIITTIIITITIIEGEGKGEGEKEFKLYVYRCINKLCYYIYNILYIYIYILH